MRVGRLVNLIMLGGGIALVLGPIADAQLNADGIRTHGADPADAAVARVRTESGAQMVAALDPLTTGSIATPVDPVASGWAEFSADRADSGVSGRLNQAALLSSVAAIAPADRPHVPAMLAPSVPAPAPVREVVTATPERSPEAVVVPAAVAAPPVVPADVVLTAAPAAEPVDVAPVVKSPVAARSGSARPVALPPVRPVPLSRVAQADVRGAAPMTTPPITPAPVPAPANTGANVTPAPALPALGASTIGQGQFGAAPSGGSAAPAAASGLIGQSGAGDHLSGAAEPLNATPRILDNQPTVGELPEPDDKALRYFAQQGDMRRLETEIQRLRALYPNWQPPRDLLEPQAQQMEDQLVQRLWDLYGQGRYSDIREAIAQRQVQDPSWQPPADLIAKMDEAEARERITNASDQQQWRQVLQVAQRNPQLLVCQSIDILWRVAEAFAKTDRDDRANDVYSYILQNCDEPGDRVSTMEKARELLPSNEFDGLFQYERKTPEGVGEFNVIRLDMARVAVGKAVTEAGATVDPQILAMLEESARKSGSAADALLVGWYLYSNNDPGQALEWFDVARANGGDVKADQGAILSLQRLERFADAEAIGYDNRKKSPDVMTAYMNAVSSWLASPGPPLVPEVVLQRFAGVVADDKSSLGARSLGWYALNTGQVPTAIAWFETSLSWDATEDAAFGLGLAAQRIGDRGRFDLVLRTYAPRFPKLPGMFADAFRPQPPQVEMGGQGVITPDGRIFFPTQRQAPQQVVPPSAANRVSPYADTVKAAFPELRPQPQLQVAPQYPAQPQYPVQQQYPAQPQYGVQPGYAPQPQYVPQSALPPTSRAASTRTRSASALTPAQVVMTTQTGDLPVQSLGTGTGFDAPASAMGYADTVMDATPQPVVQARPARGVRVAQASTGVTQSGTSYVAVPGFPQPLVPVQTVPPGYVEVANPTGATGTPMTPVTTLAPVGAYQAAPVREEVAPLARSAAPARSAKSSTSAAAACVARTDRGARTGRLSAGDALSRGWCLMELTRPAEAATAFEAAEAQSYGGKTAQDAAYGKSLAYLRLGATQNAAVAATGAPQTSERRANLSAQILAQRAVSAYNAGRCSEVFLALDERARLVPENRDLMLLRGWCYYKAGDVSAARQIFEALDMSMSTAESRSGTAEAFDVLNRKRLHY